MKNTLIACALLLSGCAGLETAVDRGAQANDAAVEAAKFCLCWGCSVGSIRREFGDIDRAELWQSLCKSPDGFLPVE